jgi:hypothetical protein
VADHRENQSEEGREPPQEFGEDWEIPAPLVTGLRGLSRALIRHRNSAWKDAPESAPRTGAILVRTERERRCEGGYRNLDDTLRCGARCNPGLSFHAPSALIFEPMGDRQTTSSPYERRYTMHEKRNHKANEVENDRSGQSAPRPKLKRKEFEEEIAKLHAEFVKLQF